MDILDILKDHHFGSLEFTLEFNIATKIAPSFEL